jgi:hypothetical protein
MKIKADVKAGTKAASSDWQKAATGYKVKLSFEGRSMTVDFWCGSLHPVPTAFDVMYCLVSDASYADYSLEEWASSFGYDEDSREALKTYKAIVAQTKRFKKFMLDSFDEVVYLDEDELKEWIEGV